MRIASYFAAYRKTFQADDALNSFNDNVPEGSELFCAFRYRMFDENEIPKLNKFYLYENFDEIGEDEVRELEKGIGKPFSLIRQMHTVSIFRYPNVEKLPSDRYLAQLVKAWRRFYTMNKIDVLLSGLMDDYAGFIGIEVAKSMGVPIVAAYAGGRYTGAYVITDSDFLPIFYKRLEKNEVDAEYKKALSELDKEGVTNEALASLADSYFNLLMPSTAVYLMKSAISSFKVYYLDIPAVEKKLWLSPPELIGRQMWYFIHSKFSQLVCNKKPVKKEKFVFFPLHFSLDAALKAVNPLINQVELVESIAKVLPHGIMLYVKPHPHWKCSDISIREMLRLNKIPNLRLLDYNCSSKELIRDSEYVIVINSSVGFEALVQGKKVVSFGSGYPPDVIPRLKRVEELISIDRINMNWEKCREFIANSYHHCIIHDKQAWFNIGRWTDSFTRKIFEGALLAYEYQKKAKKG